MPGSRCIARSNRRAMRRVKSGGSVSLQVGRLRRSLPHAASPLVTSRGFAPLYLTRLRTVKVLLTGEDLKKMGIPPGPRYKEILAELLDAKLDGLVRNREEELAFAGKKAG